ncbi:MAG: hypothetical protein JKY65_14140 [Planctomycetes bacterium]|nr:hypothetical protein [Planctomycetota bacterium]
MRKSCWALGLVLLAVGSASGQEKEGEGGAPIPLPFTRNALKTMYKKGLLIRYLKTINVKGQPAKRQFIFNHVVDHSSKGYLVRTLTFDQDGRAIGKPEEPRAIPYRVESQTFRTAQSYKYTEVMIGKRRHTAHEYRYKINLGGLPAWRSVWYSGKKRGLLLKTMLRPAGAPGQKTFTTLEIMAMPSSLGGPKVPVGAPQGNLPWTDAEIMATWPAGAHVEFEVVTKGADRKVVRYRLRRTMIAREDTCYVVREQLWNAKGEIEGDSGRPKLWVTWLGNLRRAPKSVLKKGKDAEIEAAGRKWACRVFTLGGKGAAQSITWHLSKDVPGLTVRYTSTREGMTATRTLAKVQLAGGPKPPK